MGRLTVYEVGAKEMRWRWWQPRQAENLNIAWEERVADNGELPPTYATISYGVGSGWGGVGGAGGAGGAGRQLYRAYQDPFISAGTPSPSHDTEELSSVHIKANSLLEAVCQKLGFRHLVLSSGTIWLKKRGEDAVMLDNKGEVYVGGNHRCVQLPSRGLQFADAVASKMMALATDARNDISTLTLKDREMLVRLFTDVPKEKSLAGIAAGIESDLREAFDEADNNSANS